MSAFIVLGYYTGWSIYSSPAYEVANVPANSLTHLVYAFAGTTTAGAISLLDPWADKDRPILSGGDTSPLQSGYLGGNLHAAFRLKKQVRTLKTGLSIGGYGLGSANFPGIAASSTKRTTFANSIKTAVMNYGLDFIDVDFEYPTAADGPNLILMLQKIKSVNPTLKVFFSLGAQSLATLGASTLNSMNQYIDVFQLMGLDYVGSSWGSTVASHASLYPGIPGEYNSDQLLNDLITQSTIPKSKIILEAPLYYRSSGQPSVYGDTLKYNDGVLASFGTLTYDTTRASETINDPNGVLWTGDGPTSIATKANYLITNGYKGMSFFELSGDQLGVSSLVSTAYNLFAVPGVDLTLNRLTTYSTSIYKNIKNYLLA